MYSDVLMDDPTHIFLYHLIQSCNSTSYRHIMTVPLVCIMAVMQHTTACPVISTGDTCTKMSETGFAVALNVFVSNPSSPLMAPCNLGYTSTLFTSLVQIMLVNFLLPLQVTGGYSLQYAHILVTFVLSQFLTKQPQLQLMCYFIKFPPIRFSIRPAER